LQDLDQKINLSEKDKDNSNLTGLLLPLKNNQNSETTASIH